MDSRSESWRCFFKAHILPFLLRLPITTEVDGVHDVTLKNLVCNRTCGTFLSQRNKNQSSHRNLYMNVYCGFIQELPKTRKQPKCPSVRGWVKNLWYIHTMEYYSVTERNEELGCILSEKASLNSLHTVGFHLCNIFKITKMETRLAVARDWERGVVAIQG